MLCSLLERSPRRTWTMGFTFVVLALLFSAREGRADAGLRERPLLLPVDRVGFDVGRASGADGRARAFADSFVLYGGPGQGDFQTTGGAPDRQGWIGVDRTDDGTAAPVGEFSKVFAGLNDLDPCMTNLTPQMTFLDDGTPPSNGGGASTGGATSTTWNYGAPGGWVVDHTGGLSGGSRSLHDEVWSPEIAWDDSTTTLDDAIVGGATLAYDAWMHLPLANGIFHTWAVRSRAAGQSSWSEWRDRGYVYYSEEPRYVRRELEIGDLLVPSPERVQIALGVIDLADAFGLPGTDATPSPWFDNVSLIKHSVTGPTLVVADADRFHAAFAHSGNAFDGSNLSDQAVRIDTARDLDPGGSVVVSGDSMVVRALSTQPGVALAAPPTMTWYLRANPLFDPVRVVPTTATEISPGIWKGTLVGQPATDATGTPVPDTWFFDLPDGPPRNPSRIAEPAEDPLFFPGDRLWAYVEATDTNGDTSFWLTAPADPQPDGSLCKQGAQKGGGENDPQPPRPPKPKPIPQDALPGIWDTAQKSAGALAIHIPKILVWDDAVDPAELELFEFAMGQVGLLPGRDYDVYSTLSPESGLSNGLGASEGVGATAAQLAPYEVLFYLGGSAPAPLISDGSGVLGNDKGNDLAVIEAWLDQAADRAVVSFADHLASAMSLQGASTADYLRTRLGVAFIDDDIGDRLAGLASPRVVPAATAIYSTEFVVWGGCGAPRRSDEIEALSVAGVAPGHQWTRADGSVVVGPAASVLSDTQVFIGPVSVRRVLLSFPFAFRRIHSVQEPGVDPRSASARLLEEILLWIGVPTGGTPVATPAPARGLALSRPMPNPFNPSTTLWLSLERPTRIRATIFDPRGREVVVLQDGVMEAGRHPLRWEGVDARGARVASGMYLLELRDAQGRRERRRLALVK